MNKREKCRLVFVIIIYGLLLSAFVLATLWWADNLQTLEEAGEVLFQGFLIFGIINQLSYWMWRIGEIQIMEKGVKR